MSYIKSCYRDPISHLWWWIKRPRQNSCHFPDDIFKCIFLNENAWISLKISLKFVPEVWINNTPALVQIMDWRRPGNKPLSEPMMVNLLMHICVTRPQWVKNCFPWSLYYYIQNDVRLHCGIIGPTVVASIIPHHWTHCGLGMPYGWHRFWPTLA